MEERINQNQNALLERVKRLNGLKIQQVEDLNQAGGRKPWLQEHYGKGAIGDVVQIYLNKDPDSDKDRDFPEADIELKVTGLKELKSKKNEFLFRQGATCFNSYQLFEG